MLQYLELFAQVLFLIRVSWIKQNEMNPSRNRLHSLTMIKNYRALHSAWLWLVRSLFGKRSTIKHRYINKKGMIPGSVCSSDITIDAF